VKAVVPGPYSASRSPIARDASPAAWAEALQPAIAALAEAGCPFVEVDEPDALAIAVVGSEVRRFVDAHRRLTDGIEGLHLSLALTGGNLDTAGPATFFDLPYASFAFDLIAGPDNWRLIAAAPADRGIVCGALSPLPGGDMSREVLVWAAHYAASTNGRGLERVGLANASSLAGLSRPEALARLTIVAEAARIAAEPSAEEQERQLDPRAIPRSARRRRA
jgi:methionine synthase II (cobalamin-independent)